MQLLTSTSLILKKKTKQQKSHIKQGKSHPKTKEKLLTKRQVHSITLQGLNCPPLRGSQHLYPSINHHWIQATSVAGTTSNNNLPPQSINTSAIATYQPQTTSGGNQGKAISQIDWQGQTYFGSPIFLQYWRFYDSILSFTITPATVFSWEPALWLANSQDRVWMMMSKKSIAIFGYKHWLLSLEMKTKVVQHLPRINLSHFNFVWI